MGRPRRQDLGFVRLLARRLSQNAIQGVGYRLGRERFVEKWSVGVTFADGEIPAQKDEGYFASAQFVGDGIGAFVLKMNVENNGVEAGGCKLFKRGAGSVYQYGLGAGIGQYLLQIRADEELILYDEDGLSVQSVSRHAQFPRYASV